MLVNLLNNLIEKKFYENKEEIQNKLDVFYAMSKLTDEEYTTLTLKVEDTYKVEIVEETTNVTTDTAVESED